MPTARHRPKRRHRLAALVTLVSVVVAACGTTAPTATPATPPPPSGTPGPSASQRPAAEVYAEIRSAVEAIRGLQPTSDVAPVTIDESKLRQNLEAEFNSQNSADDLHFSEETLELLGLLPAGSSLRDLTLDFQAGQVAGYYSPERNELFVVSRSGGVGGAEKVTYAHEFTHQLQDQRFDLGSLMQDPANHSDRTLAQLALIEGDAVSVQNTWTVANLTSEELGQLLAAALDPEALEALRNAPPYLRDTALFPYQDGLLFVQDLLASGGYAAVDEAYGEPPVSTEQILHPDKFAEREAPIDVEVPKDLASSLGSGWKEVGRDTLGELILRLWLREHGVPATEAPVAAAGWGGDRLALYEGPGDKHTLLLVTRWDTLVEADEFAAAAKVAVQGMGPTGKVVFDERSPTVYVALGERADAIAPRFFRN